MSILFFEGFDLYGDYGNSERDVHVRRALWNETYYSVSGLDFQSRNNGNAMRMNTAVTQSDSSYAYISLNSSYLSGKSVTRIFGGFAFNKEVVGEVSEARKPRLITLYGQSLSGDALDEGYAATITVIPNSGIDFDLECGLYNNANFNTFTIPNIAPGIWHFIEFELKVDSPSYFRVWINGSLQGEASGVTAWPTPLHTFSIHAMKSNYHTGGCWYDDMYMLDAEDASDGAQFQQRLGPIQIRPCPLISDSTPSSWVSNLVGQKYLSVDEQPGPSDLDTSFISTVSAPQTQVFRCSPYDADLPIIAATAFAAVKQPDPTDGVAQLAFVADTQEDISPLPLQGVYRLFWQDYVTLPGGAITVPVIEATDWGVRSIAAP